MLLPASKKWRWNRANVRKVFGSIAKFAKVDLNGWAVAIELVGRDRMRLLNFKHRGINKTTDILSFKLNDYSPGEFCLDSSEDGGPLGEIIVCLPHVLQKYNHPNPRILDRRMERLFVHGLAHLMGYDHDVTAEPLSLVFGYSLCGPLTGGLKLPFLEASPSMAKYSRLFKPPGAPPACPQPHGADRCPFLRDFCEDGGGSGWRSSGVTGGEASQGGASDATGGPIGAEETMHAPSDEPPTIVVLEEVYVCSPYTPGSCRGTIKSSAGLVERVKKVLEGERRRLGLDK
ncbi:Endoribonuclease YbeY [Paramicrosporidium saccamoebae]|uniref:Endoribonuclease YbeY n=1 Tax=Paramicrosporidium saccamoebae TaxID=1246581 RepID=A0A2H9TLG0_9FUNG|nr:Endoribonuclease YbeY [Paramicrosporidium saccamoebae]